MDIWTIIGIISSVLGIYSFIKNDTPLIKKSLIRKVIHYITFLKKPIFSQYCPTANQTIV